MRVVEDLRSLEQARAEEPTLRYRIEKDGMWYVYLPGRSKPIIMPAGGPMPAEPEI